MPTHATLTAFLTLAGLGQLALALGSLAIPVVLGWRGETARLSTLTRRVFWTYAGYILGAHVSFGLLSALAPRLLLDGSLLARAVCLFIACWWGARLTIQATAFRSLRPPGLRYVAAEIALTTFFVANTSIYLACALAAPGGPATGALR